MIDTWLIYAFGVLPVIAFGVCCIFIQRAHKKAIDRAFDRAIRTIEGDGLGQKAEGRAT